MHWLYASINNSFVVNIEEENKNSYFRFFRLIHVIHILAILLQCICSIHDYIDELIMFDMVSLSK